MLLSVTITYLLGFLWSSLVYGQSSCPNTTGELRCNNHGIYSLTASLAAETISGYPALIEVTLEELETGLENGQFTSVDLVNV